MLQNKTKNTRKNNYGRKNKGKENQKEAKIILAEENKAKEKTEFDSVKKGGNGLKFWKKFNIAKMRHGMGGRKGVCACFF